LSFLMAAIVTVILASCSSRMNKSSSNPIPMATIRNFVSPDPLRGLNGLTPAPDAPFAYGPFNVRLDTDGNALDGTIEQTYE
jgi:hypothetical protein